MRNATIRKECFRRPKAFPGKIDEQIFSSKAFQHSHGSTPTSNASSPSVNFTMSWSSASPSIVHLHEYEKLLLASEGSMYSIYEVGKVEVKLIIRKLGTKDLCYFR